MKESEYKLEYLINKISEFTNVNKKGKYINVDDELINNLTSEQKNYIEEIKKYEFMLQYYIK